MKRLLTFCAVTTMLAVAQSQPVGRTATAAGAVSGTVSGVLMGEDGSALNAATVTLHLTNPPTSRIGDHRTDWTAVTDDSGNFQFTAIPAGNYVFCPTVPNSTWLSPCEWNLPVSTATITSAAPRATVSITLKRGAAVPVVINDPGQALASAANIPGAGILIVVSDGAPGSFFHLVPVISQAAAVRTHQIVIPFNTPLTLFVHPTFFHLSNVTGTALKQAFTTKIALLVASGQQVAPIAFTITGHD